MVTFDFDSPMSECGFSIKISGDEDDYLATIRSLLHMLSFQNEDYMNTEDNYRMLTLIEAMLPEYEQLKK